MPGNALPTGSLRSPQKGEGGQGLGAAAAGCLFLARSVLQQAAVSGENAFDGAPKYDAIWSFSPLVALFIKRT